MYKKENTEILIFKEGDISIPVNYYKKDIWLDRGSIARLFDKDKTVISKHLSNIFNEGELDPQKVCQEFEGGVNHVDHSKNKNIDSSVSFESAKNALSTGLQKTAFSKKTKNLKIKRKYYSLEPILMIGYRVKSKKASIFRKWSIDIIVNKDYIKNPFNTKAYANLYTKQDIADKFNIHLSTVKRLINTLNIKGTINQSFDKTFSVTTYQEYFNVKDVYAIGNRLSYAKSSEFKEHTLSILHNFIDNSEKFVDLKLLKPPIILNANIKMKKKIKEYFKELRFYPDTHIYTVKGVCLDSVSKLLENFYKPFESNLMASRVSEKENKPKDQILKNWNDIKEESLVLGNRIHEFAEDYIKGKKVTPKDNMENAVVDIVSKFPRSYHIVDTELKMWHKTYNYAGTCDILIYDKKKKGFIICDWKTNKNIYKNYKGQRLLYPFKEYLDSPECKYYIQLSFYQLLIEQLPYKVVGRKIFWIKHDGNYEIIDCPNLTNDLKTNFSQNYFGF